VHSAAFCHDVEPSNLAIGGGLLSLAFLPLCTESSLSVFVLDFWSFTRVVSWGLAGILDVYPLGL